MTSIKHATPMEKPVVQRSNVKKACFMKMHLFSHKKRPLAQ